METDTKKEDSQIGGQDASKTATIESLRVGDTSDARRMQLSFNLWSTLGLVYSITATPIAVGSYLTFSFVLGGPPFYIYGYIFAVTLNIILCVALAEVSSIYPHPSGKSTCLMHTRARGKQDTGQQILRHDTNFSRTYLLGR